MYPGEWGREGNKVWYKEPMRAPRNSFNIYIEYILADSRNIGNWLSDQAEKYHCKPNWAELVNEDGSYTGKEAEKAEQEKQCFIYMWIFENVTLNKSDKLAGWIVITRCLIPLALLGLLLIYAFVKLLLFLCGYN